MANKLPPLPVGVAPGSGYWNDWYEKLRTLINSFAAGFPFSSITGLPTTLSGYGITDAQKGLQFKDEGSNLGASGTVESIDFVGAGVTATRVGNALEVDVTGGGGGGGSSLTQATGTDANTTMTVNTLYVLDGSILTANRTYTLPATAAVGDSVGVLFTAGSSTYSVILTASAGDTLNTIAGGTEWSRIFSLGETVVMECTVANTSWSVKQDGRVPCLCGMNKTSNTSVSNATATKISVDAVILDNAGGVGDAVTNNRMNIRRTGQYQITAKAAADSATISAHQSRIHKNGTFLFNQAADLGAYTGAAPSFGLYPLTTGDYLELYYYHASGSSRTYYGGADDSTSFYLQELL